MVSEAIEAQHQEKVVLKAKEVLQTDQEEKADLIVIVPLQKKNQVLFKEKAAHQDVLKVQVINQPVVHLKLLKAEDQEKAKSRNFGMKLQITNYEFQQLEYITTPLYQGMNGVFFNTKCDFRNSLFLIRNSLFEVLLILF